MKNSEAAREFLSVGFCNADYKIRVQAAEAAVVGLTLAHMIAIIAAGCGLRLCQSLIAELKKWGRELRESVQKRT
jgi:hypothetical protein